MLFSELYKIMVNKVTFVGFRGQSPPLDPPLLPAVFLVKADAVFIWNSLHKDVVFQRTFGVADLQSKYFTFRKACVS